MLDTCKFKKNDFMNKTYLYYYAKQKNLMDASVVHARMV